eukprot:TRINITY_DN2593_c0_g1_i2.p1 TRINITY_DN2593_c0_g1~~TRINITY_DN2593_c0_g1_i2.p1  ORF type:complete len:538 (-),score=79.16 TRINITY_DN2593_c0_g1_i2:32-1645(-)
MRTQRWTTGTISVARHWLTASASGHLALVAGGIAGSTPSNVLDIFSTVTNTWTADTLNSVMPECTSTSVGNLIFIGSQANVNIYTVPILVSTFTSTSSSTSSSTSASTTRTSTSSSTSASTSTSTSSSVTRTSSSASTSSLSSSFASRSSASSSLSSRSSSLSSTAVSNSNSIPLTDNNDSRGVLNNGQTTQNSAKETEKLLTIIMPIIGALIIVAIMIAIFFIVVKRRKGTQYTMNEIALSKRPSVEGSIASYSTQPTNEKNYTEMPGNFSAHIFDASEVIIEEQIGKGAAGTVFKGSWKGLPVAVKRLNVEKVTPQWMAIFRQELELMKNMEPHLNVLQFFGVIEPLSIVTEYCANGSLDVHLKNKAVLINMVMRIAFLKSIAAGMNHLARQNIVHRDLAARNCLLREDFTAVVADFGMSRTHNDGNEYLGTADHGWPIKWMAPETFQSKVFSEKTDVFSFGVVCVEVLTREAPYPEYSVEQFSMNVLLNNLVSTLPSYLPQNTPEFLAALIRQCTSQDPNVRPTFETICKIFDE